MAARRDRIHRLEILQARDRTIGGACQESTGCGPLHLKANQGKTKGLVTSAAMLRVGRWREMAYNVSKKHPHWDDVRIAHHIQTSKEGKRKGGMLPYTIAAILKHIRKRSQ